MKFNERNVIVSVLLGVFMLIVSLGGYWVLNKEQINLVVGGKEQEVSTFKTTVKDLLDENKITYTKDDIIIPSLNSEVKDYMEVKLIKVTREKQNEYEEIPFEVKIVEDNNLLKGKIKIEQDGQTGEKEKVYDLTYHDGKLVEKSLSKEIISKEAINKIVKKGIKQEYIVASRGGDISRVEKNYSSSNNSQSTPNTSNNTQSDGRHMTVSATAYATGTVTSTGTKPRWGTIAVDPRVIPYGTKVYIPQFNMTFVAEDCGGAIKGNKIDIFMGSISQCYDWGRRTIDIYIVS